MTSFRVLVVMAALGGVACGSAPPPNQQMTAAQAAIRAAEVGGAQSSPEATLHLKRAKEQVAQAKGLMANDDNERAKWVLERAEVDAELALALARETGARMEAEKAREEIRKLRKKAGLGPQS